MPFPYEIRDVPSELNQQLLKDFHGERTGFIQVGPEKWFFPSGYKEQAEKLYDFKLRPDDVWIVTYPRTGTTWTQEMMWLVGHDLDYEGAKVSLMERFPFIEFSILLHDEVMEELKELNKDALEQIKMLESMKKPVYEMVDKMASPRYIKSHLPFSLLPPKLADTCKVVYVARNPKDVAVSFYHHNRLLTVQGYQGNFEKYWDYFEKDLLPWSPYWRHTIEAWQMRNHPNVLFLFYEDMKKDLPAAIKKMAKFLNKSYSDEEVKKLAEYLDIKNFKKMESRTIILEAKGFRKEGEQPFIRKGAVGGWNEEFTPELLARADEWIEKHLKQTDLRFPL